MSNNDWDLWPDFKMSEFACPCCGEAKMSRLFLDKLQTVRSKYGKPIYITSGYRCPEYNDEISSTGKGGPHTTGKAADIWVVGHDAHALLYWAFREGFSGVGVNQKGANDERFVHIDMLEEEPRPNVWSY